MIKKDTHKIPNGYLGEAKQVLTPGNGMPCADPSLEVVRVEGFAPLGLDLVSGTSIAVGINEKGYLQPASEKVLPIGVVGQPLIGTKQLFADTEEPEAYLDGCNPNGGFVNYAESLAQLTPTVFQRNTLFKAGVAFKTKGENKALFEVKPGDCLRVIKTAEIETAIGNETLPVLFKGEDKSGEHKKTAAMYAGRLVKWDPEKDKAHEIVGRVVAVMSPKQYDNYGYKGASAFGADIQGPATRGLSRDVHNYLFKTLDNKEFTNTIIEFVVTL